MSALGGKRTLRQRACAATVEAMRHTEKTFSRWFCGLALLLAVGACAEASSSNGTDAAPADNADFVSSKAKNGPLSQPVFDRSALPPIERLGRNGIRVSVGVGEQRLAFVVDFRPLPHDCSLDNGGLASRDVTRSCRRVEADYFLLDTDPTNNEPSRLRSTYRFEIPEEDFRNAIRGFNSAAESWPGERTTIVGGTWVDVEQFVEGHLRSMASNSETFTAPTAVLLPLVHRLLLAYAPVGTVPRSVGFASEKPYSDWPCSGAEMNTPDTDGFAVGNDGCARLRRREKGSADEDKS